MKQEMNTKGRDSVRPLHGQADTKPPINGYKSTPTLRNGSGQHQHGKSTNGPAQWLLLPSEALPGRAFEVHGRERERFLTMTRFMPLDGNEAEAIERLGGEIFDASLAALAEKFKGEIAVGQLEVARLSAERSRLEREIEATGKAMTEMQPLSSEGKVELQFPKKYSVKFWTLAGYAGATAISTTAAITLIAHLFLPTLQSWLSACVAASPWALAAIALETYLLLSIKADTVKVGRVLFAALCVLAGGLGMWLLGLIPLGAPMDLTAQALLLPDRRLAIAGQLMCELAVTFLLINGAIKTFNIGEPVIVPNKNLSTASTHVAKLSRELHDVNLEMGTVMSQLANAEGNLQEWQASRAAFVEEGRCVLHLRANEAALIADLQARRDETRAMLSQFTSKTTTQNESNQ